MRLSNHRIPVTRISHASFRSRNACNFTRIGGMTCDVCDSSFQPAKPWQRRCSKKCSIIANNARRRSNAGVKMCRTCRQDLPTDKYIPSHTSCIECEEIHSSGRKRCRSCKQVKQHGEFYIRPKRIDGYSSNCKSCLSEQSRIRNSDPERKERSRDNKYRAKYGISLAQYELMLEDQDGCCAICRTPAGELNLYVDHDHATGRVRQLLCVKCNALLGQAGDQIEVLQAAIRYLERNAS